MMIKITKHCSMGCPHCMNDAKPCNEHMDWDTYKKALRFQKQYGGPFLILTGGEPTEHPDFPKMLDYLADFCNENGVFPCVTTNGIWLQEHEEFLSYMIYRCPVMEFQVTSVPQLYPQLVDKSSPIFSKKYKKNVTLCEEIENMYPQGRAKTNGYDWPNSKGPKCFNIRLILHQIEHKSLQIAMSMMAVKGKSCTPHIDIYGNIRVGESDLCPVCSNINKSEKEIIQDILDFHCDGCHEVKGRIEQKFLDILGE